MIGLKLKEIMANGINRFCLSLVLRLAPIVKHIGTE